MEYCETNEAVKIEMPEEDSFIEFQNFNRSMRVPFIVYADFESLIKPLETFELNPEKSYTKKYQEHKPSSFCYYIKCFDDKVYSQKPVKYTMKSEEDDVSQKFVDMLEKDVKSIYKIFGKPKRMIFGENEKIEFENAEKCWLCNGEFSEDDKKVRDHCHYTGKFRGAAHNSCNLKYKKPKFISIVFHNLSGYDSHLFIKNLGVSEGKINCIPTNEEKYISFSKEIEVGKYVDKKGEEKPIKFQLRFIDSYKFMASSLEKLVKNMEKEDLKIIKKEYEGEKLNHELKPLNGINNQKITLREQIDRKKLEHILEHPDDFDLSSRTTRARKLDKEGQITFLKEYLARCNSNGEQLMEYHQRNNFGRYWISENLGLQNMKRRIRHTICKNLMYDIDMKNAPPTLLSWYCHENGIKCKGLDEYILHREEFIADLMEKRSKSRDEIKAHLLAIINGRTENQDAEWWNENPKWYKKFYRGMRYIINKGVELNPELFELAKKSKEERGTTFNIKGTTVNYVMCDLKNRTLITAFNYFTEKGIEVGSLVFDGLMIYKKNVENLEDVLVGLRERVKEELGCDIIFTNKEMDEGYEIPTSSSKKGKLELLLKKGIYPYDYMVSVERFEETELPKKESFFSKLNDEGVSEEDYEHAKKVWEEFEMKTFREYHDLYNQLDVLSLADVFENFRDVCLKNYGLDPAWYFTAPGLACDAALKITKVKLELLTDPDMLLMVEKGIRGGISVITNRHGKSNNPYMREKYNENEPTKYITYLDANNLYGWAMMKNLPTHRFKWMKENELMVWEKFSCILEVDLKYQEELHDLHNDYPLAPESIKIGSVEKLIPNLNDKTKYILHCENLKQYEKLGLIITKIHRGIKFKESTWIKQYIDLNTNLRTKATNEFEKDFFKLMNKRFWKNNGKYQKSS